MFVLQFLQHKFVFLIAIAVERAFSALKLILTENRLSKDALENILLVKLNPSFLDDAIEDITLFEEEN